MGQTNKMQRADRLLGTGIEGSMSRSESGSETVRARRGAQREADFTQRFNPDQFTLDSEGRVTLKLAAKPVTKLDLVQWHAGETGGGTEAPVRDLGYTTGPTLEATTDEAHAHWVIPGDCDRVQKVVLTVNLGQIGTTAAAFTLTLEVYAYAPTDNVLTDDGSPEATLTATGTTTTTSGAAHTATFTFEPAKILPVGAAAVILRLIATTHPTSNLCLHLGHVEYTPLHYHTHE